MAGLVPAAPTVSACRAEAEARAYKQLPFPLSRNGQHLAFSAQLAAMEKSAAEQRRKAEVLAEQTASQAQRLDEQQQRLKQQADALLTSGGGGGGRDGRGLAELSRAGFAAGAMQLFPFTTAASERQRQQILQIEAAVAARCGEGGVAGPRKYSSSQRKGIEESGGAPLPSLLPSGASLCRRVLIVFCDCGVGQTRVLPRQRCNFQDNPCDSKSINFVMCPVSKKLELSAFSMLRKRAGTEPSVHAALRSKQADCDETESLNCAVDDSPLYPLIALMV
eukprot:539593-Pleurochrysis_carterae.AAC.2